MNRLIKVGEKTIVREFKVDSINLDDLLAKVQTEYELTEALVITRQLLNSCKEHLLGVKMSPEQLKNKITDRVIGDGLKIKNMTEAEAIEYLVFNFYEA